MRSLYIATFACLFIGCGPSFKVNVRDTSLAGSNVQRVRILYVNREVPKDAKELGDIEYGDTGFSTSCNYAKFTEMATAEARKNGANIVKITIHSPMNLWSSCDDIRATMYRK
jgi:hypothetical protein